MREEKSLPDMEAFEKAMAPAVEWYKKNCGPHQAIIISDGMVRLVSDEMGIPFELTD